MDGQNRKDGLECPGGAEKVTQCAFGAADIDGFDMLSAMFTRHERHDGPILCCIAQGRGSGMGIDVVDLRRGDLGQTQGLGHGGPGTTAILERRREVVCVGRVAVAGEFGVDARSPGASVLELLRVRVKKRRLV